MSKFNNLKKEVFKFSNEKNDFEIAQKEWIYINAGVDYSESEKCVCTQEKIKYLSKIRHLESKKEIYPIGSTCIKRFKNREWNRMLSIWEIINNWKEKIKIPVKIEFLSSQTKAGENVLLKNNSSFFSKAFLDFLFEMGCFEDDSELKWSAKTKYLFLIDMFNKKNKKTITSSQHWRINKIIQEDITKFILNFDENKLKT